MADVGVVQRRGGRVSGGGVARAVLERHVDARADGAAHEQAAVDARLIRHAARSVDQARRPGETGPNRDVGVAAQQRDGPSVRDYGPGVPRAAGVDGQYELCARRQYDARCQRRARQRRRRGGADGILAVRSAHERAHDRSAVRIGAVVAGAQRVRRRGDEVGVARREQQRVGVVDDALELRRRGRLRPGAVVQVEALPAGQWKPHAGRGQDRPERPVDFERRGRHLIAGQALVLHVEADLSRQRLSALAAVAVRDAASLHVRLLREQARIRGVGDGERARSVGLERALVRRTPRELGTVAQLHLPLRAHRLGVANHGPERAGQRVDVEQLIGRVWGDGVRKRVEHVRLPRLTRLVVHAAVDADRERPARRLEAVPQQHLGLGRQSAGVDRVARQALPEQVAAGQRRQTGERARCHVALNGQARLDDELGAARHVELGAHRQLVVGVGPVRGVGFGVALPGDAVRRVGARQRRVEVVVGLVEDVAARQAERSAHQPVRVVDADGIGRVDAFLVGHEQRAHVRRPAAAPRSAAAFAACGRASTCAASPATASRCRTDDAEQILGGEVLPVHVVRQRDDRDSAVAVQSAQVAAREVLASGSAARIGAPELAVLHARARDDVDCLLGVPVVESREARRLAGPVENLHLLNDIGRKRTERALHVRSEELAAVDEHALDRLALGRDRPVFDRHAGQLGQQVLGAGVRVDGEGVGVERRRIAPHLDAPPRGGDLDLTHNGGVERQPERPQRERPGDRHVALECEVTDERDAHPVDARRKRHPKRPVGQRRRSGLRAVGRRADEDDGCSR